jgi:hypothetical protein
MHILKKLNPAWAAFLTLACVPEVVPLPHTTPYEGVGVAAVLSDDATDFSVTYRPAVFEPAADPARDALFAVIQEEWIYTADKPRAFDQILDAHEARLLRVLDCEHYECRQLAVACVRSLPTSRRVRLLFWGSRARSPEVANTCQLLLDGCFLCPLCRGDFTGETQRTEWCPLCKNSADLRFDGEPYFEGGEYREYRVPSKRLFPCLVRVDVDFWRPVP